MLRVYETIMKGSAPFLRTLLQHRCDIGKEDLNRIGERMGRTEHVRPAGRLIWLHAASVGEAQSALIVIQALLDRFADIHLLVTTGTLSSAVLMEKRLPDRAFHQFYPLDHPEWVDDFLNHWRPDIAIWMESEIWPIMFDRLRHRDIAVALLNARLSPKSRMRWGMLGKTLPNLLGDFERILAQTEDEAESFRKFGLDNVHVIDNLKYAAAPLPFDEAALTSLHEAIGKRPLWLYASTHEGEEELACRLHQKLARRYPNLLTIIVPRHPERREHIINTAKKYGLRIRSRTDKQTLPDVDDGIYLADTLGELGLFYRLSPIACIGRSFSFDGGGGHNPIEAAQLDCAVLHGPNVQNLAAIFADLDDAGAAIALESEADFQAKLDHLLSHPDEVRALQDRARQFVEQKSHVLDTVMDHLSPLLARLD